jgi:hypothetical protein
MPTVSYRADTFPFDNPSTNINTVYNDLVQLLPQHGCTNVLNEGSHVHCNSVGISISITFLPISGSTYWRVIMAAEDASNPATADAQIQTIVDVIDTLIEV